MRVDVHAHYLSVDLCAAAKDLLPLVEDAEELEREPRALSKPTTTVRWRSGLSRSSARATRRNAPNAATAPSTPTTYAPGEGRLADHLKL
jgi:hypothetical protein